jgi:hypothetical protein
LPSQRRRSRPPLLCRLSCRGRRSTTPYRVGKGLGSRHPTSFSPARPGNSSPDNYKQEKDAGALPRTRGPSHCLRCPPVLLLPAPTPALGGDVAVCLPPELRLKRRLSTNRSTVQSNVNGDIPQLLLHSSCTLTLSTTTTEITTASATHRLSLPPRRPLGHRATTASRWTRGAALVPAAESPR